MDTDTLLLLLSSGTAPTGKPPQLPQLLHTCVLSLLRSRCKGTSPFPARGKEEVETNSRRQGPGSCLLEEGTGLGCLQGQFLQGLLLLGLPSLQTETPGTPALLGRSPLVSPSCPRSPRLSPVHSDHTPELHPAERVRSVSSRETAALSAAVSCFSTKQSATWAPLFFPLMQLHKM